MLEHLFGVREVGDDAVLHRTNGRDVPGRAPQHALGLRPDGDDDLAAASSGFVLHCDDGRLIEHNALVTDVDEHICCSQAHRQIAGEITAPALEHELPTPTTL